MRFNTYFSGPVGSLCKGPQVQLNLMTIQEPHKMSPEKGLSYSLRRYHVDAFYERYGSDFASADRVLDLGGTKLNKRGQFNIYDHTDRVTVVNIDSSKGTDIVCDASSVPFGDGAFDVVICAELLEHVPCPEKILSEVHRMLNKGGKAYITVPFLFPIHADPYDYARYTATGLRKMIEDSGLTVETIAPHGEFYGVLFDMVRMWLHKKVQRRIIRHGLYRGLQLLMKWAARKEADGDAFTRAFTSGYGVIARQT